jgi:hypothetical protein
LQKKGENGKTKEDTKNPNVLKGNKTQQRGWTQEVSQMELRSNTCEDEQTTSQKSTRK